jgi:steroid delta-isomerase-like uncharacterized protein
MTSHSTSPAMNTELVRAACRALNAHNVDECLAHIAPDFIINLAELPEPMHGQQAWRQNFETMKHAFPDFQAHIEDIVAAQDKVAVRLRIRGTHSGDFLGIPATAAPSTTSATSSTASPADSSLKNGSAQTPPPCSASSADRASMASLLGAVAGSGLRIRTAEEFAGGGVVRY